MLSMIYFLLLFSVRKKSDVFVTKIYEMGFDMNPYPEKWEESRRSSGLELINYIKIDI